MRTFTRVIAAGLLSGVATAAFATLPATAFAATAPPVAAADEGGPPTKNVLPADWHTPGSRAADEGEPPGSLAADEGDPPGPARDEGEPPGTLRGTPQPLPA